VVSESLSAVLLFRELAAMDEDAPGAVEDDDSLGEELSELFSCVLHEIGSRLKGREPEGSRRFRRFGNPVAKLPFKALRDS
jgi:hypothetical protein